MYKQTVQNKHIHAQMSEPIHTQTTKPVEEERIGFWKRVLCCCCRRHRRNSKSLEMKRLEEATVGAAGDEKVKEDEKMEYEKVKEDEKMEYEKVKEDVKVEYEKVKEDEKMEYEKVEEDVKVEEEKVEEEKVEEEKVEYVKVEDVNVEATEEPMNAKKPKKNANFYKNKKKNSIQRMPANLVLSPSPAPAPAPLSPEYVVVSPQKQVRP